MNINDSNAEQRSLDWFRARLGMFTGSRVSDLMTTSRKKDEIFGETAKSYIYELAAERMMKQKYVDDDEYFEMYLQLTSISSKAMEWGSKQEGNARNAYESFMFPDGNAEFGEVSSCRHPDIAHFAASPDGLVLDRSTGKYHVLEIKCPNMSTYMRYRSEIRDADSLKAVKKEYYWQTQAEMACTDTDRCDFISFNPWVEKPLHVVTIERNDTDINAMLERVRLADEMVEEIINK